MDQYHIIDRKIQPGTQIYAFDKLDGSNFRAEWGRKQKGFWKFGSKTQMVSESDKPFGEGINLVKQKYEKELSDIFKSERWEKVTCFFEFWGKHSFAGNHEQEPHDVTLFDIKVYKKGFLLPREYLKLTKNIDICKLLYVGNANQPFVESVENGTLQGMTFEGVVCKGSEYKTPGMPWMFKIKNKAWVEQLKNKCNGDEELFNKLL